MKKSTIKKIIVLTLSVCACVGGISVCAQNRADDSASVMALPKPTPTPDAQPQYTAILTTYNYLHYIGSGQMNCQASTNVRDGYNAGVTVELQQNNNGWNTIKTWSDSGDGYAAIDTDYGVSKGYSYRLKVTHRSYTSSWSLIESETKYSDIVTYK